MMQKIKNYFITLLCIPIIFLCGCTKKPICEAITDLSYYYESNITCDLFKDLPDKTVNLSNLTKSKLDKSMLDSYAQITLKAKSAEIYHMYIEYLYFKVYTNETSEFELNVNINITNAVKEEDISVQEPEDNTFTTTYSCIAKAKNTATFKVYVNRTIATATGSTITIDILESEIYATNSETSFKWCIFDFKILGESRAY